MLGFEFSECTVYGVNKLCSDCYQVIAVLFAGFIYAVVAVYLCCCCCFIYAVVVVLASSVQIIPKLLAGKQVLENISWYSIKY